MDFTSLIASISSTDIINALTALAVIKISVDIARWGYNQVIIWFNDDYEGQQFLEAYAENPDGDFVYDEENQCWLDASDPDNYDHDVFSPYPNDDN